jgi:hypothetical protein
VKSCCVVQQDAMQELSQVDSPEQQDSDSSSVWQQSVGQKGLYFSHLKPSFDSLYVNNTAPLNSWSSRTGIKKRFLLNFKSKLLTKIREL